MIRTVAIIRSCGPVSAASPVMNCSISSSAGAHSRASQPQWKFPGSSTYREFGIASASSRPRADDTIEIDPLLPADVWDWFALDDVRYHNRTLTVLWDRDGTRYGRGKGLSIWIDGAEIARRATLGKLTTTMPARR